MPAFTICNESRRRRKLLVAHSLEDLKSEVAAKLGFTPIRFVLDINGIPIEEDEVVLQLSLKDTIMATQSGEWSPIELQSSSPHLPQVNIAQVPSVVQMDYIANSKDESSWQTMPPFGSYIRVNMLQGHSDLVWGCAVKEAAYYYLSLIPRNGKDSNSDYQIIGKLMYQEYPSIKREWAHPWSAFVNDLFARIRHVRWSNKRKSIPESAEPEQPPTKRMQSVDTNPKMTLSEEDYNEHVKQLAEIAQKLKSAKGSDQMTRLAKQVNILLKETLPNRGQWIEGQNDSGGVKLIIDVLQLLHYSCLCQ